jgi:hypothetical protein
VPDDELIPFGLGALASMVRRNGWSFVLAVIGVGFLLSGMFSFVPQVYSRLDAIQQSLAHVLDDHQKIKDVMINFTASQQEEKRLLQAICINLAQSNDERQRCIP